MKTSCSKIAVVMSQFNSKVTEGLLRGAFQRLNELGIEKETVLVIRVPGAVEIPLVAKVLAKTDQYDAIVCLGAVIRGDTDHYDYVCQQVSYGCQKVALEYHVPIIFGILTTQNEELALARSNDDKHNKGRESIDAALQMIETLKQLS